MLLWIVLRACADSVEAWEGGRRAGLMLCSMVKKQDTQQARDLGWRRLHFFNIDKGQDAAQFKIG